MSFGTRPANRRGLTSLGVVLAMVAALLPFTLGTAALANGVAPVAFDMVGSTSQNLTSYTNAFTDAWGAGDAFQKFERPDDNATIPYAVADDSISLYPTDTAGIIDETNLDEFFGISDTENSLNAGPVSATWVFDISSGSDYLDLSIDMGAMGDFEAADSFVWTYSIDGGSVETAFTSSVDEDGSNDYTMANGTTVTTMDDPLSMNGTMLTNVLQTLTVPLTVPASPSTLTLTLTTTTDGGSEGFAFQDIVITNGVAPFVSAYDMVGSTSQNLTSYTNAFTDAWGPGDAFQKFERPDDNATIPYAVADDSISLYPTDTAGIIDETNLDEFFGISDTENGLNSGTRQRHLGLRHHRRHRPGAVDRHGRHGRLRSRRQLRVDLLHRRRLRRDRVHLKRGRRRQQRLHDGQRNDRDHHGRSPVDERHQLTNVLQTIKTDITGTGRCADVDIDDNNRRRL